MGVDFDIDDPSPLSLVQLPEGTFDRDLNLSDKYRDFSAELLRLSLFGIGGIGFLIKDLSNAQVILSEPVPRICLVVSLGCLGISAAGALMNRRFSTSSLAMHLVYLRLRKRSAERDNEMAESSLKIISRSARFASMSLKISVIGLGLGALFLAVSFMWAILLVR